MWWVQLMTLILQLLFEPHFKRIFTVVLLGHYSQLMEEWSVKPPEAVMPLDMITVQLFNDEVCDMVIKTATPKQDLPAGLVLSSIATGSLACMTTHQH